MHKSIKNTIKASYKAGLGLAVIQQIVKSNFQITLSIQEIQSALKK